VSRQADLDDVSWPATNVEPSANWRPGQRLRDRKSVSHTLRHGVASMLRSVARRDDFDVPNLTELAALQTTLDEALVAAVLNLRLQDHSWAEIGEALGVSKQAAYIRFNDRTWSLMSRQMRGKDCG
jgi:hypothetical protein